MTGKPTPRPYVPRGAQPESLDDFPDFPVAGAVTPPGKPAPPPAVAKRRRQPPSRRAVDGDEGLDDPEGGMHDPPPPPPKPFLDGRLSLRSTDDVLAAYEDVLDATGQGRMPAKVTDVMTKLLAGAADLVKHKERPKLAGAGMSVTVTGAPQGSAGPFAVFAGIAGNQPALPAPRPEVPVIDLAEERREEFAALRREQE